MLPKHCSVTRTDKAEKQKVMPLSTAAICNCIPVCSMMWMTGLLALCPVLEMLQLSDGAGRAPARLPAKTQTML